MSKPGLHPDQDKVNVNILKRAKKRRNGIPVKKESIRDKGGKELSFRFVYDFGREEHRGWRVDKKGHLHYEKSNE